MLFSCPGMTFSQYQHCSFPFNLPVFSTVIFLVKLSLRPYLKKSPPPPHSGISQLTSYVFVSMTLGFYFLLHIYVGLYLPSVKCKLRKGREFCLLVSRLSLGTGMNRLMNKEICLMVQASLQQS